MKLLEQLRKFGLDDRDIESVFAFACGGPQRPIKNGVEFLTGNESNGVFARLLFNKKGAPNDVQLGRAFLEKNRYKEFLQKVEQELAPIHGAKVYLRVMFSHRPLLGSYAWDDRFKIRPCSAETKFGSGLDFFQLHKHYMPKKNETHFGPPYPFVLEVKVPCSPNPLLENARGMRLLDRYQLLVSTIITGNLGKTHHSSNPEWTLIWQDNQNINHLLHQGFDLSENGIQEEFSGTITRAVPVYEDDDYYNRFWSQEDEIKIPRNFEKYLREFEGLSTPVRDAFLRACYWYTVGIQHQHVYPLSIVAFSTAIECLIARPTKDACKSCGKSSGNGPTKLFNRHIDRYSELAPELKDATSPLYSIRSDLVHGNRANIVDHDWLSTQNRDRDSAFLLSIVAQRSLVNWLADSKRINPTQPDTAK